MQSTMDNQRLILLLVFFFSCMMLWDAWQRKDLPPPTATSQSASITPAAGSTPGSAAVPSAPTAAVTPGPVPTGNAGGVGGVSAAQAPVLKIRTDLVNAEVSAQGGDLVRLELLKHQAHEKPDQLFVLLDPAHAYAAQSGLIATGLPNHKSLWKLPASISTREGQQSKRRVPITLLRGPGAAKTASYAFAIGGQCSGSAT